MIDVQLFNDQQEIPLRGSPYVVQYEENSTKNWNKLTGPLMDKYVKSQLDNMKNWIDEKTEGTTPTPEKDVQNNVQNLIIMKDHVEEVLAKNDKTILELDQLDEALKFLHKDGLAKDNQLRACKKLFDNYNKLKKQAKETKKTIEPFVDNETDKNKNIIKRHEDALKTYYA